MQVVYSAPHLSLHNKVGIITDVFSNWVEDNEDGDGYHDESVRVKFSDRPYAVEFYDWYNLAPINDTELQRIQDQQAREAYADKYL